MKKYLVLSLLALSLLWTALPSFAKAPLAPVRPDTMLINGTPLTDAYPYMKDKANPLVKRYLKQSEQYATQLIRPSQSLEKQVYREFRSRLRESEISQPYYYRGYYYYTRDVKGKPYPLHCRKAGNLKAKEQVILDENKLAGRHKFFSLGCFSLSPDQNVLAYSVDYTGSEIYRLYLKDLRTGKARKTRMNNVSEAIWMKDNQTLLLTTVNERMQTDAALRWSPQNKTIQILYTESDPAWDVSIYQNCDESMVFLSTSSKDASEAWFMPADDYSGNFTCLMPRRPKHIYSPDYYDGNFYIRTNLYQADYDLAVCARDSVSARWHILYQGAMSNPIESFLVMENNLVVLQRKLGFKSLTILNRQTGQAVWNIIPNQPTDLNFWVNPYPKAADFFYTSENEITPLTIYKCNLADGKSQQVRQYLPAGPYNPSAYVTEVFSVNADDGTRIPLILTYKRDLDLKQTHHLKLGGYGAYGDCNDPYFSSTALSYLDRGFILATAHIRGGGELGQNWYDKGRLLNKKNSFTDFVSCMDFVINRGLTTPSQLIIEGASAGGLLMGAVTNLAWDKCALVVAEVPFVDLMHTMLDASLPLTVQEYEEWGNPNEPQYFDYMLSYSPIDNVQPHPFPAMYISTAWNDTRVGYWEGVKWAAKLRANNTGNNPILLKVNKDEGHTGQVDRYKVLRSYAKEVGYILYLMGK